MPHPRRDVPSLRLRPEAFTRDALRRHGYPSLAALADEIGVDYTTLFRARAGLIAPGERLLATLLWTLRVPFEELVEVREHTPPGATGLLSRDRAAG
jgi:hypothetical protein